MTHTHISKRLGSRKHRFQESVLNTFGLSVYRTELLFFHNPGTPSDAWLQHVETNCVSFFFSEGDWRLLFFWKCKVTLTLSLKVVPGKIIMPFTHGYIYNVSGTGPSTTSYCIFTTSPWARFTNPFYRRGHGDLEKVTWFGRQRVTWFQRKTPKAGLFTPTLYLLLSLCDKESKRIHVTCDLGCIFSD